MLGPTLWCFRHNPYLDSALPEWCHIFCLDNGLCHHLSMRYECQTVCDTWPGDYDLQDPACGDSFLEFMFCSLELTCDERLPYAGGEQDETTPCVDLLEQVACEDFVLPDFPPVAGEPF